MVFVEVKNYINNQLSAVSVLCTICFIMKYNLLIYLILIDVLLMLG